MSNHAFLLLLLFQSKKQSSFLIPQKLGTSPQAEHKPPPNAQCNQRLALNHHTVTPFAALRQQQSQLTPHRIIDPSFCISSSPTRSHIQTAAHDVFILPVQSPAHGRRPLRLPQQPPWRTQPEGTEALRLPELPQTVPWRAKHEGAHRVGRRLQLPDTIREQSLLRPGRRHGVLPQAPDRE